ncbi:c-type cytochrome [Vibrio viridaestus]|uniref:Cytochrome c n=1 Tax=Vibrio viridaestus TaxID=2487322 RepID=A0A3N9TAU3_9VIBR|nr:cytochrome c [Vibrio viridaestus]RQW61179.1 cytochrome c [Vibrio viridaestus]
MKKTTVFFSITIICMLAVGFLLLLNNDTSSDDVADNVITAKTPLTKNDMAAVERGKYIALAGDCVACHTSPESKDKYAGGYAIETPFGQIYSTNITPDPEFGIGNWTERDFFNAVRHGRGKDGKFLYPAMPYNAYVKVSNSDMHDLWMYIRSLKPVSKPSPKTNLPFPYNIRLAMMGWNLLFFDNKGFQKISNASEEWNRGAYLVQGLEHCASCHTPKNIFGGDKDEYLHGGQLGNWFAPDITSNPTTGIGSWTNAQIMDYLHVGSNHVSVASGPMAEAVFNSTQYLSTTDLQAISVYLKSTPPSPHRKVSSPPPTNESMKLGSIVYSINCSACHNSNGHGIPNLAAGLANNPGVVSPNASSLITTVLQGGRGAVTQSNPTSGAMPSFAWKLSDKQVAAAITYIRNSWGNTANEVSEKDVKELRKLLQLPEQLNQ